MTSGTTLHDPGRRAEDLGIKTPCQSGQHDLALWFPEGNNPLAHAATDEARRLCIACPLRVACRDWALTTREPHGIFGGLTEAQRRTLLQGKQLRDPVARWLAGQLDDTDDEDAAA